MQPEREAAERVVSRLSGIYAAHVALTLERWERRFYEASQGFQEAIAAMESFDLVVGVLWKRIGSELPPDKFSRPDGTPFESGTVYEIETALAANRRSTRPTVYVFKSTRPVTFTEERVEEERAQKQALDRWWARTFRDAEGHYICRRQRVRHDRGLRDQVRGLPRRLARGEGIHPARAGVGRRYPGLALPGSRRLRPRPQPGLLRPPARCRARP